MSAPSQCVKWMISDAAMPGKRYFVPPEKPTTSCGKTGPQMSTWSYSMTSRLSATGTSCFRRPRLSSSISARGDGPERRERRRVVPPVIEDPAVAGAAVDDRSVR